MRQLLQITTTLLQMQRLLQIAIVQQFNASTSGVSNTSNFKFQIS